MVLMMIMIYRLIMLVAMVSLSMAMLMVVYVNMVVGDVVHDYGGVEVGN